MTAALAFCRPVRISGSGSSGTSLTRGESSGSKSLTDELGGPSASGRAVSSSLSGGVGASQPVKKWGEELEKKHQLLHITTNYRPPRTLY